MKNILEEIIEYKKIEVAERKNLLSEEVLLKKLDNSYKAISLVSALKSKNNFPNIIAEHKLASPSKGRIYNGDLLPEEIATGYQQAGATAISVLTDKKWFQGDLSHLEQIRKNVSLPILRKEFIVDPYQILEAKIYNADAILLIAAALPKEKLTRLGTYAKELGLEVLYEVHDASELELTAEPWVSVVGVNNRSLKTMEVDWKNSVEIFERLPDDKVKISESGIDSIETIKELQDIGYNGFLMGEVFMKEADPGGKLAEFLLCAE